MTKALKKHLRHPVKITRPKRQFQRFGPRNADRQDTEHPMLNDDRVIKPTSSRPPFPFAEGAGIFVGIASWYLLSEGQLEIVKSLGIAAPAALLWYGLRCWKNCARRK